MRDSPLAALQERFQSYVQRGDGDIGSLVVADAKADAGQRMDVYFHAYRLRLVEVLSTDYPAVAAVAGSEEFDRIARGYVDAHPSGHPSVRWFGRHFAAYLRAHEPQQALLAELAAFEWAQGEAFDARDAPALPLEEVARIPGDQWPDLRFTVHPSLRRLELEWNVGAIAQAVDGSEAVPEAMHGAKTAWVLWRRDLVVRWRSLSVDEAVALDAVRAGAAFGEVCELLCEHVDPDSAGMHAASLLKRWLSDGLLTSVRAD
jgi:hypothetical protein